MVILLLGAAEGFWPQAAEEIKAGAPIAPAETAAC